MPTPLQRFNTSTVSRKRSRRLLFRFRFVFQRALRLIERLGQRLLLVERERQAETGRGHVRVERERALERELRLRVRPERAFGAPELQEGERVLSVELRRAAQMIARALEHLLATHRVAGKLLVMNIRRLPSWILSMAHHKATAGIWPDYEPQPMPTVEEMTESKLPDDTIRYMTDGPRFPVDRTAHERLLQGFAQAAMKGDLKQIKALLAEQVELVGDGGGKVPSFGKVLRGRDRLAHLYYAVALRARGSLRMVLAEVNGMPGLLRYVNGELESVQSFETDGRHILRIHSQRNPDKLQNVRPL